jgi:hypothetical protein
MGRYSKIIVFLAIGFACTAPAPAAEYVPGMTCHEVGGFAEAVAVQKSLGDTLKEQIAGMHQSTPGYPRTRAALEKIIRAIYANLALRSASPENVGKSYEQACIVVAG